MMKHLQLGLFILLLISCSSLNSTSTLYKKYSLYSQKVNKDNIIVLAGRFFSVKLLGNDYQSDPDAIAQLLFNRFMSSTESHFEAIKNQEGCLIINGYDKEKSPLVFKLKYIEHNGNWLIDDIHIMFVDRKSQFLNKPQCFD